MNNYKNKINFILISIILMKSYFLFGMQIEEKKEEVKISYKLTFSNSDNNFLSKLGEKYQNIKYGNGNNYKGLQNLTKDQILDFKNEINNNKFFKNKKNNNSNNKTFEEQKYQN